MNYGSYPPPAAPPDPSLYSIPPSPPAGYEPVAGQGGYPAGSAPSAPGYGAPAYAPGAAYPVAPQTGPQAPAPGYGAPAYGPSAAYPAAPQTGPQAPAPGYGGPGYGPGAAYPAAPQTGPQAPAPGYGCPGYGHGAAYPAAPQTGLQAPAPGYGAPAYGPGAAYPAVPQNVPQAPVPQPPAAVPVWNSGGASAAGRGEPWQSSLPAQGCGAGPCVPVAAPPFAVQVKEHTRTKGASQTMNRMGLLSLAQTALSFFWQVPLLFLLLAVGVDVTTDSMGYLWLSAVMVPLATALPFALYLLVLRKDPGDYLKFERVGFTGGALCVLAGLALVLLANYPALAVQNFFQFFGYESTSGVVSGEESLPAILLELAVTAVLVPFLEEFAFRGVVLSALRRYGIGFSIVASALIFGMAHMDLATVVFATLSGLVFGFLYAKTNNLWLTVWIHALNNGIAVVGSHTDYLFGSFAGGVDLALMLVPIGLGLVALVLLCVFRRGMFITQKSPRYDGPPYPLTASESALAVVRTPMFWVAVGLVVVYFVYNAVAL